jgi:hypothetical protein
MDGLPGDTAIETRAREFTPNVVEALILPSEAVIVVEPPLKALANPVLAMAAIDGCEELQFAELVRF